MAARGKIEKWKRTMAERKTLKKKIRQKAEKTSETLENGERSVQRTDVRGKILDNRRGTKDEGEKFGHGVRTEAQRGKIEKWKRTMAERGKIGKYKSTMDEREALQKKKYIKKKKPETLENGKEVQRTDVRGKILDTGRGTKDKGEIIGYGRRTEAKRGNHNIGREEMVVSRSQKGRCGSTKIKIHLEKERLADEERTAKR